MFRRATTVENKENRRNALLDAAMALWQAHPERIISMAEVAQAAGVAKGTLYLYFKSKEDMLLAAHERLADGFFTTLVSRASDPQPVTLDDMVALTLAHVVDNPTFLPLAVMVGGLMHKAIAFQTCQEFEQRMAQRLLGAGRALIPHFGFPNEVFGAALLRRSYGLILGLWQLYGSPKPFCQYQGDELPLPTFSDELDAGLRALWRGSLQPDGD